MSLILFNEGYGLGVSRHLFYGGTEELIFDSDSWTWFRVTPTGRERLDGVTNVVHVIDKSQALMPWAVRKSLEKLRRLLIEAGCVGLDANSVLTEGLLDELVKSAKKADKEELENAGAIGHAAHAWIESYIKAVLADDENRRLELLSKFPDDERASNACGAAIEWMHLHNVRWLKTERKCYSRLHGYAGTLDGLARVDSCSNVECCPTEFKDRFTLVDWKTSNYLYIEYLFQTAAYQQAYQEEEGLEIDDRWIIRLGKDDGAFDPWHAEGQELFENDLHGFLTCLALVRSVRKTEERISAVKEERRARAKAELKIAREKKCLDADTYKGTRKKKGCNKSDKICEACNAKFLDLHPNG